MMVRILLSTLVIFLLTACQNFANLTAKQKSNASSVQKSSVQKTAQQPLSRSKSVALADRAAERNILTWIKQNDDLRNTDIDVLSYNGIVLLTGQVNSKKQQTQISDFLQNMQSAGTVKAFHNQVVLEPGRTFLNASSDWMTATEIQTRIFAIAGIDRDRIRVKVYHMRVYLIGMVTREEAQQITRIAQETNGIKKVVLAFEYLD